MIGSRTRLFVGMMVGAGLASAANAQRNAIDIRVRLAGTADWADVLLVSAGSHVEVGVFYERDAGYGFYGSVHNVIVSNWGADDTAVLLDRADSSFHPDGRQGRFNFGGQRQAAYTTGADAGTMRVAAAFNTQNAIPGGISVTQNSPAASGSLFDTSNAVLGFRFDIVLGSQLGSEVWNLSSPADRVYRFGIYENESSTAGTTLAVSSVILDGAVLTTVPGPGWGTVLGMGGALALRRKRSSEGDKPRRR